jgi:hypothetical protein
MSRPKPPEPAKLIIGLFTPEKSLCIPVVTELERQFGPVDYISRWLVFDYTSYYTAEMGAPLFRRLLSFKQMIEQDRLPHVKNLTNELELKWVRDGKRLINIDPGYLVPSRFVLATGKDFSHRIYIGQSIYADLTLLYVKGKFQTLPWTYPDYADQGMQVILDQIRSNYMETDGSRKSAGGSIREGKYHDS